MTFLGTAAAAPTRARNVSATLVQRGPDRFLIDCGEGTQRQLQWSSAGLSDLGRILLTHNHADHYLGLPGLLKSYANRGRSAPLTIFGPPGTWMLVKTLSGIIGDLPFSLKIVEFEGGETIEGLAGYDVRAVRVDHRLPALGWVFAEATRPGKFDAGEASRLGVPNGPLMGQLRAGQDVIVSGKTVSAHGLLGEAQKGIRVVFSGDSRPCTKIASAAQDADLLVHEGTFLDSERAEAIASAHSTVQEAAELAKDAGVQLLAITHVSSRYALSEVKAAAKQVFPRVVVPADFDLIEVPYRSRGLPTLVPGGGLGSGPGPKPSH